jgi:hypothetical protein
MAIKPSGFTFVLKRTESADAWAEKTAARPRTANNRNPLRMVASPDTGDWLRDSPSEPRDGFGQAIHPRS